MTTKRLVLRDNDGLYWVNYAARDASQKQLPYWGKLEHAVTAGDEDDIRLGTVLERDDRVGVWVFHPDDVEASIGMVEPPFSLDEIEQAVKEIERAAWRK